MEIQEHNSSDICILFLLTTNVYLPIQFFFFIQILQQLLHDIFLNTKYTLCFLNYYNIQEFLQPLIFSETLKIYYKFKLNHTEVIYATFPDLTWIC